MFICVRLYFILPSVKWLRRKDSCGDKSITEVLSGYEWMLQRKPLRNCPVSGITETKTTWRRAGFAAQSGSLLHGSIWLQWSHLLGFFASTQVLKNLNLNQSPETSSYSSSQLCVSSFLSSRVAMSAHFSGCWGYLQTRLVVGLLFCLIIPPCCCCFAYFLLSCCTVFILSPHYSPIWLILSFSIIHHFYHPSSVLLKLQQSPEPKSCSFSFNFWFSSVFSVFLGRREKKYKYILGKVPIQNNSQGLASDVFPVVQNVNCHVPNLQKENNAISIL